MGSWRALELSWQGHSYPGKSEKPRNVTWEYVLAALLALAGEDVTREEPDVRSLFRGRRYGFAAKVPYSQSSVEENVRKAALQLEDSPVELRFIVLNLAQLAPHEELYDGLRRAKPSATGVEEVIHGWNGAFNVATDLANSLRGRSVRKLRAILSFIPTIVFCDRETMPHYRFWIMAGARMDHAEKELLEVLHKASQSVQGWRG